MVRRLIIAFVAAGAAVAGIFWFATEPRPLDSDVIPAHRYDAIRGGYLFTAAGCASCHAAPAGPACDSPKSADKTVLSGGRCLKTAFGTFFVPNISPDPTHGIGDWTDLAFVTAMKLGIAPDGKHYYPAFPYAAYQRMTVPDILDVLAYLKTLPKSAAPNRPHELAFPYSVRRGVGLWQLVYVDGQTYRADTRASAEIQRGGYLVEALGHCAECHSARNALGGIDEDARFAGGPAAEGKGFVPNITPHADGLAAWSAKQIAYALETGFTPEFDALAGTMGAVIENTAQLPPEDRAAIAAYLKTLPPRPSPPKR